MPKKIQIRLKKGREKALKEGHPWLFSGAIESVDGPRSAPLAVVEDARGKVLGIGLYSPKSQIRVRLLGDASTVVDPAFFTRRLKSATDLRHAVVPEETTGYRLVNAEGDFLPGWTVDRYGDVLVSQVTAAGLEPLRDDAYAALRGLFPETVAVQQNDLRARRLEGLGLADEILWGETGEEARFTESGLCFTADLRSGQKTGFYCDQRENRRRVERLASGRSVLDLFAHSGAFGLYALRGGAASVVAVESSARSIERGRLHQSLNGFADDAIRWVRANVFEDLRQREERYGVVVCDPPPLIARKAHLERGARAYKDLHRLALRRLRPGGFLFTFSCSAAMSSKLFRQVIWSAAVESGVRLALLEPLAAGADHPVSLGHPQGEYLKGWWGVAA